ncbi:two component LuxR family transcriptional regulator [Caballeronia calidae]|uniref:Two component LuxR family transcriptional regulator n=1 Tax=Caballeronia calidae TaxID=1777139 RepID=A0A158EIE2_9BURK|nr:hypothetical protein [Caballeronia calidae]SAL06662.1 two component LuxR family transcriptional regulator [Caballeronia calidae]
MDTLQVLVIDKDAAFRQGVVDAIRDSALLPGLVIQQATSAHAYFDAPGDVSALDGLIVDWDAEPNASVRLAVLRLRFPGAAIIVSSSSNSLLVPRQAFAAGAAGFVRRDGPPLLVRAVIELVLSGEAFALPDHLRPSSMSGV